MRRGVHTAGEVFMIEGGSFLELLRGAGNSLHLTIDFFSHMRILHLEACFWLDLSTGSRFGKSPL